MATIAFEDAQVPTPPRAAFRLSPPAFAAVRSAASTAITAQADDDDAR